MNSRKHNFMNSRKHNFMNSRKHNFMNSRKHKIFYEFTQTQFHEFTSYQQQEKYEDPDDGGGEGEQQRPAELGSLSCFPEGQRIHHLLREMGRTVGEGGDGGSLVGSEVGDKTAVGGERVEGVVWWSY